MEKLKPCPFCGCTQLHEKETTSPELCITCIDCGAGAFVSDWNQRPIEDDLKADRDDWKAKYKELDAGIAEQTE